VRDPRRPARGAGKRRTHCRQGHPLRGDNILHKRQTDGRVTRLCRQCFQARWRAYQRQWRRSEKAARQTLAHAVYADPLAWERRRLIQVLRAIVRERRTQERKVAREARQRRRSLVWRLAQQAGLHDMSGADLVGLFALLGSLTQVPNPVAVLESLLASPGYLDAGSVDGMAQAAPGVSTEC
jgi:hypothetical protein